MVITIRKTDKCIKGCGKQATELVYSRALGRIVKTCYDHYEIVMEEGSPEYYEDCPNCGCHIPVN
jgi:hypothetical protein